MIAPASIDWAARHIAAGHVEDLGAQVDRRHGEAADLAPAARHVQVVDARRRRAERLRRLPDEPARGLDDVLASSLNVADQTQMPTPSLAEGRLVVDDQPAVGDVGDAGQRVEQLADRWTRATG